MPPPPPHSADQSRNDKYHSCKHDSANQALQGAIIYLRPKHHRPSPPTTWLAVVDGVLCRGPPWCGRVRGVPPGIARDNLFTVEPHTNREPPLAVRPRDFSGSTI